MPKLDAFFKKWLSRKLIVFVTATVALFMGHISGAEWSVISATYLAAQGLVDGVGK